MIKAERIRVEELERLTVTGFIEPPFDVSV